MMMKHLLTAIACCLAVAGSAQTFYPWNPDSDNDNIIGVEDLMSLLSVFGDEFTLEADSIFEFTYSLYDAGELNRYQCVSRCKAIGGRIPLSSELMMWDSTLMDLPFNHPPSLNINFAHDRIGIWSYQTRNDVYLEEADNSRILVREPNTYNIDNWTSFETGSSPAVYPSYCFCIGAVPNPAFIE